jgi:mannan endo-1,4-beta-mannosidase
MKSSSARPPTASRTKIGITLAAVAAIVASIAVAVQPAQAAVGIRISNGRLVEGNGQPLILRGVNHMHTWYKSQTASYAAIKATGANAVRVVVSGGRWQPAETTQDIVNIVNLCKTNRLICILENHDTTGFNEDGAAFSLDQAVNFWISVQSALTGQENYVILNIGNEPFGNGSNPPLSAWITATTNAIQRLRNAGFQHTIMVDAPNWGQDWQFVMRDNAQTVYNADPSGNTILSIHMYGVFPTANVITAYIDSFINRGLPIAIGEFGWVDSDEDAILATAQARSIGYLSWSWSGNTDPILDMVVNQNGTFLHDQKTSWGTRIISGANGLQQTSREATIYSGQTGTMTTTRPPTTTTRPPTTTTTRPPTTTTRPPTTTSRPPTTTTRPPTTTGPPAGGCTATYVKRGEWQDGFHGEVNVTNTGSGASTAWTVGLTFPNGQRLTQLWGGLTGQTASPYTIRNESWNGAVAPGQSAMFGFLASWSGTNGAPTLTCSRTP